MWSRKLTQPARRYAHFDAISTATTNLFIVIALLFDKTKNRRRLSANSGNFYRVHDACNGITMKGTYMPLQGDIYDTNRLKTKKKKKKNSYRRRRRKKIAPIKAIATSALLQPCYISNGGEYRRDVSRVMVRVFLFNIYQCERATIFIVSSCRCREPAQYGNTSISLNMQ